MRPRVLVSALAFALYWLVLVWLVRADAAGPVRFEVDLAGNLPATLLLPREDRFRLDPVPRDERPPAVVLMHGFASDRALMSPLARSLARAGYAVLSLDLRGHGANRTPMADWVGQPRHGLLEDVAAAVEFLRTNTEVDGSRLAVMGHSMGAGASLEYATRDSGLDAAVMISGGWHMGGPQRPPNALFVYAALDPDVIRASSAHLAARLADVERAEEGRRYGDFARGTAVRHVEVPGTDHLSIVWTDAAVREIASWLDAAFGVEREVPAGLDDPRLAAAGVGFLLLVLVLPGLGHAVGRLAPPGAAAAAADVGPVAGLGLLAGALAAVIPLAGAGAPGGLLSVEVGDVLVPLLAYAGIALLAGLALAGRLPAGALRPPWAGTATGVAVGIVALYALMTPLGVVFHRLALTPERALVFAGAFVGLAPFALAFQMLLRRGSPLRAALVSGAGRLVVLVLLAGGIAAGIVPFVVSLMFVPIAVLFALFEILAVSIYATSPNRVAIALLEAAWFAWITAAINPIRA